MSDPSARLRAIQEREARSLSESVMRCVLDYMIPDIEAPDDGRTVIVCTNAVQAVIQAHAKPVLQIDDALHGIFTTHGIASRQLPGLMTDVIQWAAQTCRQTHSAEVARLTQELAIANDECRLQGQLVDSLATCKVERDDARRERDDFDRLIHIQVEEFERDCQSYRSQLATASAERETLRAAARQVIEHRGCSDPDCCEAAIKHNDAIRGLASCLAAASPDARGA